MRGTQIWFGQGCAARASKPIPIFKGHFGRKEHPFLGISLKCIPIFLQFLGVHMTNTQKNWKNRPTFIDIFVENGTHA